MNWSLHNNGVLISIKPKWCALIASGAKTVEIRKSRPSIATPFKCYIYCTKPNTHNPNEIIETHNYVDGGIYRCNGKVMGWFVCDGIAPITFDEDGVPTLHHWGNPTDWRACVSAEEARKYCGDTNRRGLFAWHITNYTTYDKPKELKCFQSPQTIPKHRLYQVPQSWCYVEELEEYGLEMEFR